MYHWSRGHVAADVLSHISTADTSAVYQLLMLLCVYVCICFNVQGSRMVISKWHTLAHTVGLGVLSVEVSLCVGVYVTSDHMLHNVVNAIHDTSSFVVRCET